MKHSVLQRTSRSLLALALAMYLLFSLTACSRMENVSPNGEPTRRTTQSAENAGLTYDLGGSNVQGVLSSGEDIEYYVPAPVKNPGDRTVTLFIWNVDTWKTVQWHYRDTLTAKKLLAGLAYVTNWDLTCEVKPATQKLTFRWDKASSLFSGIPLRQNKEYWIGNQKELDACILDSVYKTMLENLGPSYTVYYADAEGNDLELTDVGITIPANVPYSNFWQY